MIKEGMASSYEVYRSLSLSRYLGVLHLILIMIYGQHWCADELKLKSAEFYSQIEICWILQVELCGHATLAAAHFCFTCNLANGNTIEFSTLSGILTAKKVIEPKAPDSLGHENGEPEEPFFIELDFPAISSTDCNSNDTSLVSKTLTGVSVIDIKKTAGDDLLVCEALFIISYSLEVN